MEIGKGGTLHRVSLFFFPGYWALETGYWNQQLRQNELRRSIHVFSTT
jgi:hypothetical protein